MFATLRLTVDIAECLLGSPRYSDGRLPFIRPSDNVANHVPYLPWHTHAQDKGVSYERTSHREIL